MKAIMTQPSEPKGHWHSATVVKHKQTEKNFRFKPTVARIQLQINTYKAPVTMKSATGAVQMEINKKDGYRQQNVRQRQKLISIRGLSRSLKLISF